ncbi:hypothetical protein FRC06_010691, partial [Ceratobasidium sp. 370]
MEGTSQQGSLPRPPPVLAPTTPQTLPDGTTIEPFPLAEAGSPISDDQVNEEDSKSYLASCGDLADPDIFEIAELLMTIGLSDGGRNKLLKSKLYKGKTTWRDCRQMLKEIDKLRHGAEWKMGKIITKCGDHEHTNYVFGRDLIATIRELIGNRRFKKIMRYAPVRHWRTGPKGKKSRVYSEMWTADWWWRLQATIAPLIIASDKTSLSMLSGGQQAYPVYLTIGNISKSVRRKAKQRATILIGYLPVDKFEDVKSALERARLRADMTHRAMDFIMAPLKTASGEGVEMWCADGRLRRVYPIVAAFVGDWPEQNMMAATGESGCPSCMASHAGRGGYGQPAPQRKPSETLAAIRSYFQYERHLGELEELKLKPWWPWWAGLPYTNFHAAIAPDLLHQLHQGLFKSHIMPWAFKIMKDGVADRRFMAMSKAEGMRHFKTKVSKIKHWTGRESKELMKQFLPVLVGSGCDPDFIEMVRAALDFMYYAHSAQLTTDDLEELEYALETFHRLKKIVVRAGIFEGLWRFDNIPKIHMLSHYAEQTRELGTPDGFNTESPEHLHIVYAKTPYRASNKVAPTKQMIKFIERQDALRIHKAYLNSVFGPSLEDCLEDETEDADHEIVEIEEDEDEELYEEGDDECKEGEDNDEECDKT